MKALGTIYASFVLILIVTAMLIASYQVLNNALNKTNQAMHSNIKKIEAMAREPALDLSYINNSLYLVIQAVEPVRIEYVFIDYMNGTIIFDKIDRYIENTTYIKLPITQYTQPFKTGIIIDPGITIYYNPMKDPWITARNIIPNTTYIDQKLITALQKTDDLSTQASQPIYNPVLRNNTIIIKSVNTTISKTLLDLTSTPLRIELQISRLISPNFTLIYPTTRSKVLENNGVAKIASIVINGYPLNIYAVYTTFPSTYLFSMIGLLINSTYSTNIVFNGTIRVEQSMKPTVINLGGYLVKIFNQNLNIPLALAPISNTSIDLVGKQYVKQVGLNKETFLSINGSVTGNITSDGLIILSYGRYIDDVWGKPTQINITVELNITSIELINIEPKPIPIEINSKYITIREWHIGTSVANSDNYAKGIFNIFKIIGYQNKQPILILNYGSNTVYREITGTTSPLYVKSNYTIEIIPSIPKWILQWHSPLQINVITTRYSAFQLQYFKVLGDTIPSNTTAVYITLLPDALIIQEYPSKKTILVLLPHFQHQISINPGYEWEYLTITCYEGTNITINNPTNNTVSASIIPIYLQSPDNPLTLYYEPKILNPSYPSITMKPGENTANITLSAGYYLLIPIQQNTDDFLEPLILKVI
ncbi:MAG: hypothetical protein GXO43_06675 [Crenarchaeota archaeon]|nr:hypothetical protein [Thermoproteota archaeon]